MNIALERARVRRESERALWGAHLSAMDARNYGAARRLERAIFGTRGAPMPEDVKQLLSAPYHSSWVPARAGGSRLTVIENPSRVHARQTREVRRRIKAHARARADKQRRLF